MPNSRREVHRFAGPLIYGEIILPLHLDLHWRTRHSPQFVKAMDASFPSDRWPATEIVEPDGTVRFVLKDGTEIIGQLRHLRYLVQGTD